MKKTFKILSLAVVSFMMMTACNSDKKQIESVAVDYLRAINIDCDFNKAKQFATPETQELLTLLEQLFSPEDATAIIDSAFREKFANSTIDILAIEIEDDSIATVEYKIVVKDKDGNIDTEALSEENSHGAILVKKVDSKWLAHQPKETPEEEMMDEEGSEELLDESIADSIEMSK